MLSSVAALPLVFRVLSENKEKKTAKPSPAGLYGPPSGIYGHQVLVFKYCGQSDFHFCPRGTLEIKTQQKG